MLNLALLRYQADDVAMNSMLGSKSAALASGTREAVAELEVTRRAAVRLRPVLDDLAYWARGAARNSSDPQAGVEVEGLIAQAVRLIDAIQLGHEVKAR